MKNIPEAESGQTVQLFPKLLQAEPIQAYSIVSEQFLIKSNLGFIAPGTKVFTFSSQILTKGWIQVEILRYGWKNESGDILDVLKNLENLTHVAQGNLT